MSTSPSITVLNVVNGEVQWDAPIYDLAAVTQIIYERLLMFQGEWWASTADGLPLWQSILGQGASISSQQQMETLISQRILGTPFVISLSAVAISFNQQTRQFSYSAQVQTQFGVVPLSNVPIPGDLQ
jgi:hypothetical protein